MTVSSFTSVSLHPPLILVCIDKKATFLDAIEPGLPFIVNVLSDEQQHLAKRFADHSNEQRFAELTWTPGWLEIPVIEDASATFECAVRQIVDAGDHVVLISDVRGVSKLAKRPLVWCERRYHCLPPIE